MYAGTDGRWCVWLRWADADANVDAGPNTSISSGQYGSALLAVLLNYILWKYWHEHSDEERTMADMENGMVLWGFLYFI